MKFDNITLDIKILQQHLPGVSSLIADRLHKVPGVFSTRTYSILRVYKYAAPDMNLVTGG